MWPFKSKEQKEEIIIKKQQDDIQKNKDKIEKQLNHKFSIHNLFDMNNFFVVFNKTTWTIECYNDAFMWSGIQKAVEALNTLQPLKPSDKLEIIKVNKISFTSL